VKSYSATDLAEAKDAAIAAQGSMLVARADAGAWSRSPDRLESPVAELITDTLAERVADAEQVWRDARAHVRAIRKAQLTEWKGR